MEPPVKDSFVFAEEIVHKVSKHFTGSLGVESLFTYIPVKKTINIYTNLLYNDIDVIEGIGLSLRTFYPWLPRNCILFNNILYKQKDGVALGSALEPAMANVFYHL